MDPIKNNGMADYTMTIPQQAQNNINTSDENDYSTMPMVYDPVLDEKQESAKNGTALKALAALGIAGLAIWGGHAWGSKAAKAAKEAEDIAKKAAEEANTKAEKAIAEKNTLKQRIDEAFEIADKEHTGWFDTKSALRKDIKKALKPDSEEVKVAKETEIKAEEAEIKTEDTTDKIA